MRILCFGDSNTWGYHAEEAVKNRGARIRFSKKERWTGILEEKLGQGTTVLEEGLCGRTTVFADPFEPGRRGMDAVRIIFESQQPVDLIIVMLGTNDLKHVFHTRAEDAARGVECIAQEFETLALSAAGENPKILLVSPIRIESTQMGEYWYGFSEESKREAKRFAEEYRKIAEKHAWMFLEAEKYTEPCIFDGVHLNQEGHRKLGEALAEYIKKQNLQSN